MMHDNAKILSDGLNKAYRKIVDHLTRQYMELGTRLLKEVASHRQFRGFTGNTQTSYACGVYVGGSCRYVIRQTNWNQPPVRAKVQAGKFVFLQHPYEGEARGVRGKSNIQTDGGFGADTSVRFLLTYKGIAKEKIGIVICTGTEYSQYLENIKGLDVLTGTYEAASDILKTGFKPIENSKK